MRFKRVVFFANKCNIVNSVCFPYQYVFTPGLYLLEVWGASGGNATITHTNEVLSHPTYGGKGGYSKGIILIDKPTNGFIYVGEKGFVVTEINKNSSGTFGGGGWFGGAGGGHRFSGAGGSGYAFDASSYKPQIFF